MRFNQDANTEKYAQIALACGAKESNTLEETAKEGIDLITRLSESCGIPTKLSAIGISVEAVERMAQAAMQVTRLLKNNPKEVTLEDAKTIYSSLY